MYLFADENTAMRFERFGLERERAIDQIAMDR
jgi:hypothetical protein